MMKQHVLFICSQNKLRSPTAEHLFSSLPDIEVDSAGTGRGANVELTEEHLEWATHVVCMEQEHASKIRKKFGHVNTRYRLNVLGIEDQYEYMDPSLIWILEKTMAVWYLGNHQLSPNVEWVQAPSTMPSAT